jgi:choline-sulfatase
MKKILVLLIVAIAFVRSGEGGVLIGAKPNVLIILVDALRADYLGCYGFKGDISPAIDTFSARSTIFKNCYAQASWTKPSVATLFTSLYPEQHGLIDEGKRKPTAKERSALKTSVLSDSAVTLAEILKKNGYETVGLVDSDWLNREFGFSQGFDRYDDPGKFGHPSWPPTSDALINKTIYWLGHRSNERPFFLYLHLVDVHAPYQADRESFAKVGKFEIPEIDSEISPDEWKSKPRYLTVPLKGKKWKRRLNWRKAYASGVTKFDQRLSRLFDYLNEKGIDRNTLIVFTSDHGEEFLEHGQWHHGLSLHNQVLHVPLLIHIPGQIRSLNSNFEMGLIDVAPTLLASMDIPFEKPSFEGRNLSALLSGGPAPEPRPIFSSTIKDNPDVFALVSDGYKLIWDRRSDKTLIYNLRRDPYEREDLPAEYQPLALRLRQMLDRHLKFIKDASHLDQTEINLNEEQREKFRSLGYLQ